MIIFKQVSKESELRQILELQQQNLNAVLEASERKQEGFVTVAHTFDILKDMNQACPHIIAMSSGQVVGYALSMHPKFANTIDVLKPMFYEINRTLPKIENYLVMGQICIAKAYRKQGIFRKLYETMQNSIAPTYKSIITEVDARNTRSIDAHYAIGFKLLKSYQYDGQQWQLIILA
ncbi:GNAT family N-acetyltransferase [uncultured Kriegella sp.]|uniref:GNAT family N-acetyltransferase n=1 Tax=uncultured Kriegella sp. TaxID=1798910 RepID=UPI0030DDAACA|tara:strand:- start:321424 stop:321954 length:531 start_codon:yes stop_codon:yes gene_type:complete